MITKAIKKHSTLCWECEKAGGKCSWSRSFTPVDGWKAIPTKILNQSENEEKGRQASYTDSFDVYECPEFELMEAIKRQVVAGVFRSKKHIDKETIEEIKRLRTEDNTVEEISRIICLSERQVFRILKKIKESEENGKTI